MTVFTIGHSTRPLDETLALLRAHGVTRVADVRSFPHSRRNPQYDGEAFAASLAAAGIGYAHLRGLGGRRRPRPDSVHTGWRIEGFRAYADHMASEAFAEDLAALIDAASRETVAAMCAEAVPWRCHRQLLADALAARGVEVRHILDGGRAEPHALTAFARVEGGALIYDGDPRARRGEPSLFDGR